MIYQGFFVLSSVLYIVIMIRDKCSVGKMYNFYRYANKSEPL